MSAPRYLAIVLLLTACGTTERDRHSGTAGGGSGGSGGGTGGVAGGPAGASGSSATGGVASTGGTGASAGMSGDGGTGGTGATGGTSGSAGQAGTGDAAAGTTGGTGGTPSDGGADADGGCWVPWTDGGYPSVYNCMTTNPCPVGRVCCVEACYAVEPGPFCGYEWWNDWRNCADHLPDAPCCGTGQMCVSPENCDPAGVLPYLGPDAAAP